MPRKERIAQRTRAIHMPVKSKSFKKIAKITLVMKRPKRTPIILERRERDRALCVVWICMRWLVGRKRRL